MTAQTALKKLTAALDLIAEVDQAGPLEALTRLNARRADDMCDVLYALDENCHRLADTQLAALCPVNQ